MAKSSSNIADMFGATKAGTFLGLPAAKPGAGRPKAAILGVPCASPYWPPGVYCKDGPAAIRGGMAGYTSNIKHFDFDLGGTIFPGDKITAVDCGDVPYAPKKPAANRKKIRDAVCRILDSGAVPILLGGDDSIPIPMFQSYEGRGKFTILQIDAHIDWRDEVRGERMGLSSTMRRASEMGHIERIIQVGRRAIGSARPKDVADATKWGVKFVNAREVAEKGTGVVERLIPPRSNVILSFDLDGLDPTTMPAVIGPAPGGLSYWDAVRIMHAIGKRARLAGAAFVEFVPDRDVNGLGALTAARLVVNALGIAARQR